MFRYVFIGALIVLPACYFSTGEGIFPIRGLNEARMGNIEQLCQWICDAESYSDYDFFRNFDEMLNPRIFCGICRKKQSTTSTTTTTTTMPSSTTSVTTSTTTPSTTTTTSTTPSTTSTTTTTTTPSPTTTTTT